jgi:tetratricopeptide (TPR) repeat protein
VLGVGILLIVTGTRTSTSVGFHLGMSWSQYLFSQGWAIPHYLSLIIWPDRLTLDYGQNPIGGLAPLTGLIALALLGVATIVAWVHAEKWAWFGFLGAWFFLILAPSSSIVPIRTEIAAERRIYLAFAAVAVLAVVGAELLRRRMAAAPNRAPRWIGQIGWRWTLAGLIVLLVVGTGMRSRTYADPEVLWRDAIAKVPRNPRAYDNLAYLYRREIPPRTDEAKTLLNESIAVDSTFLNGWDTLAEIAIAEGKTDEGIRLLERALSIDSTYVDAGERLGNLLVEQGKPERAIPILQRVAVAFPNDECFVALATAYAASGKTAEADRALRRAIDLNPSRVDAMRYLGASLVEQGRGSEAVPYLKSAVDIDPASAQGFALLGLAHAESGGLAEATQAAQMAMSKTGPDPSIYVLVGRTMTMAGRRDLGAELFRRALQLSPNYPPAKRALVALGERE